MEKIKSIVVWFKTVVILILALLFFVSQPAIAGEKGGDTWEFSAQFIPWLASIDGETATGSDIDMPLHDILDNLNMMMMANFEARKNKWVFFFDVVYLDMEDGDDSKGRLLTLTDIEMTAWVLEPTVGYTVLDSGRWHMDVLAGARCLYMKIDVDLKTTPPLPDERSDDSSSESFWDGIIGVRGQIDLDSHWSLPFYLDVGTGDTNFTWQAAAGVGYKFESFTLNVGYRYLAWDWDDEDKGGAVLNDLTVSGPVIGFKYIF